MNKPENDTQNVLADLPVTDAQADATGGGAGTRDSHFRESTLGNELMNS
jgi:hypothetical protein